MKRLFLCIVTAALFLVGCDKTIQPEQAAPTQLRVAFTIDHPDGAATKVIKKGWEVGDVVFIFFEDVESGYLKMEFTSSGWIPTLEGSLKVSDLSPSDKLLTAVFLPFGNDETPTLNASTWEFSKIYRSYHLTADRLFYTVETTGDIATLDVSGGKIPMSLAGGYVQFYVKDASAVDGKALLGLQYLKPYDIRGVSVGCKPYYDTNGAYGDFVPGYAYQGGYLFSGYLSDAATNKTVNYDFTLVVGSDVKVASKEKGLMLVSYMEKRSADITGLAWKKPVPEAVDLGLPSGVKWADSNLGAGFPASTGNYYSWGSLDGQVYHSMFSVPFNAENNPLFATGTTVTKYCTDEANWAGTGTIDKLTELQSADDAATSLLGGSWRMPTLVDFEELANSEYTTTEWLPNYLDSGISGLLVTGKKTGNSIFLPGVGFGVISSRVGNPAGFYWTSTLDGTNCLSAISASFGADGQLLTGQQSRSMGCCIRPVQ